MSVFGHYLFGQREEVRKLIRKSWAGFEVWGGVLLLVAGVLIAGGVAKPKANASDDAALDEKIVSYVRERFGIPDTVKVTATPFQSSNFPGFLASTITTDDGKEPKKTTPYSLPMTATTSLWGSFLLSALIRKAKLFDTSVNSLKSLKLPSST